MHSRRIWWFAALFAVGCGGMQQAATTQETARERVTASSTVSNVTVALPQAGWNSVGLQSQRVSALTASPAIAGMAVFENGAYQARSFTAAELSAGAGGRRGLFVFSTAPTSFTYSGTDDATAGGVDLVNGYNLVSFTTSSDLTLGSLPSNVLPTFQQVNADNSYTPVNVQAGGLVRAGRAYWVFSNGPARLTLPSGASPTPTPSTLAIASLSLSPSNSTVNVRNTIQYSLIAVLADGTSRDVTAEATWSSADPFAAALLAPGLFKGLNPLATTVSASLGGQTAQSGLLVVDQGTPPGPGPAPSVAPPGLLYVASFNGGTLMTFPNAAGLTAAPTPATTITGLPGPEGVAVDGGRNRAYVACNNDGKVRIINNASTADGPIGGVVNATIEGFTGVASCICVDPVNDRLFVGDSDNLRIFDKASTLTDGDASALANSTVTGFGFQLSGIVVDPPNNRLFVATGGGYSVRIFNNAATVSGTNSSTAGGRELRGAATGFDDGLTWGLSLDLRRQLLYVATAAGVPSFDNLSTVDGNTRFLHRITGFPTGDYGATIVDPNRDMLYVANALSTNEIRVYNNASTRDGAAVADRSFTGVGVNGPIGICIDFTR